MKAYAKPPQAVMTTMEAVMILKKATPSWEEAKKQLGDPNFLMHLVNFDKDSLTDGILNKVSKYTRQPDFDPEVVGGVSKAAKSLCMWVRAMEVYGRIAKEVAPKREKLKNAMKTLAVKQKQLQTAQEKVKEISDRVLALREKYTENVNNKDRLRMESEELEVKLDRAKKLVEGLGRAHAVGGVDRLARGRPHQLGGRLPAGGGLPPYCGPFDSEYRAKLVQGTWIKSVKTLRSRAPPTSTSATSGERRGRPRLEHPGAPTTPSRPRTAMVTRGRGGR